MDCPIDLYTWPTWSMNFLHCSGWPWLALWITFFRFVIFYFFLKIAREWSLIRKSDNKNILTKLINVFIFCGWCGYGLLGISAFPGIFATICYWVESVVLVFLAKELRELYFHIKENEKVENVYKRLSHGQMLEDAANSVKGEKESLDEAIENVLKRLKKG